MALLELSFVLLLKVVGIELRLLSLFLPLLLFRLDDFLCAFKLDPLLFFLLAPLCHGDLLSHFADPLLLAADHFVDSVLEGQSFAAEQLLVLVSVSLRVALRQGLLLSLLPLHSKFVLRLDLVRDQALGEVVRRDTRLEQRVGDLGQIE